MPRELRPRKGKATSRIAVSPEPDTAQDSDINPYSLSHSSDEDAPKPKSRKARKATSEATRRRARVKGKLAKLWATMPIETLCQIYGYLSPLDLLHMSRTCKAFARFLLHPSSHSIWREARELMNGLPECPEDLTEPKYAALCFSSTCNRCGKPNCHKILWVLRRRWCESCRTAILGQEDEDYMCGWSDVVPSEYISGARRVSGCVFRKGDIDEYKVMSNVDPDDEGAQIQALDQIKQRKERIGQHARACLQWEIEKASNRNAELSELRAARVADIEAKLMKAGWPKDQITYASWRRLPNVYVAKPLTKSAWQILKPNLEYQIEADINHAKEDAIHRIESDVVSIFSVWLAKHAPTAIRPSSWHITKDPEVESRLVDLVNRHEAPYRKATIGISSLADRFENLTTGYQDRVTGYFSELMTSSLGETRTIGSPGFDHSAALTLATALFRCERDETTGHHFPELWWHGPGQVLRHRWISDVQTQHLLAWPDSVESEKPWYSFDRMSSDIVYEILLACGMPPESTTLATLDANDPRVVCAQCEIRRKAKGLTMSWRAAIKHWAEDHQDSKNSEWRVLTAAQKAKFITTCEEPKLNENGRIAAAYTRIWQCRLCEPGSGLYTPQGIKDYHRYQSIHSVPEGEEQNPKYCLRSAIGLVVPPIGFSPED